MTIAATCHCGRVRIVAPGPPDYRNECSCSVCYKYGALWAYYKTASITIEVEGHPSVSAAAPAAQSAEPLPGLATYVRADDGGTRASLAFVRCAHCGCMTHWTCIAGEASDDHETIGVNSRLMEERALVGVERRQSPGPE
ncbi:hypothetical protein HMPREF1624_08401 [Sporothrix schenckii ATCC 58251]|uniref:CENP-V/GFA domain-containing protein n=1 Tax=Sporothrix schenckii (strain ATCC 58251 / de Perez 2211183) TaxID=1391915 RepID=U7PKY4_SPOS1|nr:hypothetical protein HMPREF1624_08401 [Sporothrix schenckii ATCC 58251]